MHTFRDRFFGDLAGDAQLVAAGKEDCVDAIEQFDLFGVDSLLALVDIELDDLLDAKVGEGCRVFLTIPSGSRDATVARTSLPSST